MKIAEESVVRDLSGVWDFAFAGEPLEKLVPATVSFTEAAPVPGCFDTLPDHYDFRGCGIYRKRVVCGGKVRLFFGGITLRGAVWFDGRLLGFLEHPLTPEELVFDAGKRGEHTLVVAAENLFHEESSSQFHQYYDYYGFGGICREVTLEELPDCYIQHISVIPLSAETGEVKILVSLAGNVPEKGELFLCFDTQEEPERVPFCSSRMEIVRKVPSFRKWEMEHPFLHSVLLSAGKHVKKVSFGIRVLSWNDGKLRMNGKEVKLIGYNRHDSHPQFGYAVPLSLAASDLHQIQAQGCNFIRGCHYPQSEKFLELCDRMGMLVWDETLAWGNKEEHLADPLFRQRQKEAACLMVRASVNHPSVILWGFLNECASETKAGYELISQLRQTILAEDSSRPITFASSRGTKEICLDLVDVVSFNAYPAWYLGINEKKPFHLIEEVFDELVAFAEKKNCAKKPFLISETGVAAIIGERNGERWSEDYQSEYLSRVLEYVLRNEKITGLAVWQFANSRTYSATSGIIVRPRGMNNKGVVDEYRRPKMAWFTFAELLKKESKKGK